MKLAIIGCNAAGLKQKMQCLSAKIRKFLPGCIFIQETKLYRKGQIKIDGYQIFELVRKERKGGGLLLALYESFDPVLVHEGTDDIEILVVQGKVGNINVRFINAYGPQEDDKEELVFAFYEKLEEEVILAKQGGCQLIIECDANAKLGSEIIKGAPDNQSKNGILLWSLIERNSLTVVNSLDLCEGVITRERVTTKSVEKSVLDYVIICDQMKVHLTKMVIDESRVDVLTKYAGKKGMGKIVSSDHNMISAHFNIDFVKKLKNQRYEVFQFKDTESQKLYLEETSKGVLTKCFSEHSSVEQNASCFLKSFKRIVYKCFRKVRVKTVKITDGDEKLDLLDNLKSKLKNENKHDLVTKRKIESLESEIQQCCAEENAKLIRDQVRDLSSLTGTFSSDLMWKVKRKVFRRSTDPPMAKKDNHGNIITSPNPLKKLYLDEYIHRLRHREIKPSLRLLKELKEDLWARRFDLLKNSDCHDWSEEDILKVMNSLKGNKCRDPLGFDNILFKPGICGPDLVSAMTILCNTSKNSVYTPSMMRLNNISTIYKNKGSRFELVNDRGIFNMSIFRKIVDRLIYDDKYEHIDANMSDSNVGGRKGRSIRNHLFIVYGIINSVMNNESPPIDIQLYDLKQCFDAMWLEESMNDICETIPRDEWDKKIALVYKNNSNNQVAVKTPFGLTERIDINNIVTQGGVWGPIQCSNQIDMLGKECITKNIHLFTYKGLVKVPPLAMIDDILAVALCGMKSFAVNTFINTKIEIKKLGFSRPKCKHMHVGADCPFCPTLEVHGEVIDKSAHEKYLGDTVADTLPECNTKNVANRKIKGLGVVAQIMSILDTVSLGYYLFEISAVLRESLFINGFLCNSEVWYGITQAQIDDLHKVDKLLLRRILRSPISTPSEAMHLELGLMPLQFILKGRRLMYLHYLLNLNEDEMLSQFFYAQWNYPGKRNEWTQMVKEELSSLGIPYSLSVIKCMSQYSWKNLVGNKCKKAAFDYLLNLKDSHSKLKDLSYDDLCLQSYFTDGSLNSNDARLLFLFRTRMVRVYNNYKNLYTDILCPLCRVDTDTQEHLLRCTKLPRSTCCYTDIFGTNAVMRKTTLCSLKTALSVREDLLAKDVKVEGEISE